MPGLAFDTYESVKSLKAAGFNEGQAEALMSEFKKVQESSIANLATKDDIKDVRQEIKDTRQELKDDIKSVQQEVKHLDTRLSGEITLLKWMLGFMLAGILSLVMKAFFIP